MEINDFLELYSGKWFSQRTHYNLAGQEVENSKAELAVELLHPENPLVKEIWSDALGALKTSWDNSLDWNQTKQIGTCLLVFSRDGRLFWKNKSLLEGFYRLEQNEMLILTAKTENREIEERIWFASENFRLRTTVVKQVIPQTSFYSEIRKLPPQEN